MNVTGYCNRGEILEIAQSIDGPVVDKISEMAKASGLTVLAGFAEKSNDGRIHATHIVAAPEGIAGTYRKIHIAPPEQKLFKAGDKIPVFSAAGIRFGIQLCYDAHFPELSSQMAVAGAEIIFIPHASPRGSAEEKHQSWMRHLSARAYDNSIFVVACNQTGENCNGLTFPGNAVILNPSGDIMEKSVSGNENLLVADLKARSLEHVRGHEMRYFLPNRRPELYRQ